MKNADSQLAFAALAVKKINKLEIQVDAFGRVRRAKFCLYLQESSKK